MAAAAADVVPYVGNYMDDWDLYKGDEIIEIISHQVNNNYPSKKLPHEPGYTKPFISKHEPPNVMKINITEALCAEFWIEAGGRRTKEGTPWMYVELLWNDGQSTGMWEEYVDDLINLESIGGVYYDDMLLLPPTSAAVIGFCTQIRDLEDVDIVLAP